MVTSPCSSHLLLLHHLLLLPRQQTKAISLSPQCVCVNWTLLCLPSEWVREWDDAARGRKLKVHWKCDEMRGDEKKRWREDEMKGDELKWTTAAAATLAHQSENGHMQQWLVHSSSRPVVTLGTYRQSKKYKYTYANWAAIMVGDCCWCCSWRWWRWCLRCTSKLRRAELNWVLLVSSQQLPLIITVY